jgi:solute carrier family 45 protein 1/2/4
MRRSKVDLLKIGMIYFGIELLFSLEVALTIPILLESNVSKNVYSYVYFLSPILGFLFQPVLGVLSDRCESSHGKRRPFIFILSILAYAGIGLILNGRLIGNILGNESESRMPIFGVILTTLGVTVLDFSADSADSPLRAYLLETCHVKDQNVAFNLHAFLGGIGAAFGYILSAINWEGSFLSFLGN